MHISTVLASLYVRDLSAAADWYATLFGRGADHSPHPHCREWEVVPDTRVQILQAPDERAPAAVAFVVADVSQERDRLFRAGATVDAAVEYAGFVRTVEVRDPEGNTITLVQSLRPATRRGVAADEPEGIDVSPWRAP